VKRAAVARTLKAAARTRTQEIARVKAKKKTRVKQGRGLKSTKQKSDAERLSQYWTPADLAKRIVDWADVKDSDRVLEPSAGAGRIAYWVPRTAYLTVCEIDPVYAEQLRRTAKQRSGMVIYEGDFLQAFSDATERLFDVAIMNPPYEDGADGQHVAEALRLAHRVVALVRANFCWGTKRYQQLFRWARITRRAVLVRRPDIDGPADIGHGARHDFQVIELVRREHERWEGEKDRVAEEYWL
jgi:predicted RNA methylase